MTDDLGEALGTDFFTVREQFTDEQWDRFITTRRFVDNEVLPVVADYWERAELAWPLIRRLPELGIVGEGIKGYGAADEQKPAAEGSVEAWGRSADNPVGGWYGLRKGYRGRFGMYLPPLLEHLGLAELTHDARNNKSGR